MPGKPDAELHARIGDTIRANPDANNEKIAHLAGCSEKTIRTYKKKHSGTNAVPPPVVETFEERLERDSKIASLKQKINRLEEENELFRKTLEQNKIVKSLLEATDSRSKEPPRWLIEPHKKSPRQAIPTVMLSDMHLDEVVKPEQVGFVNEYNRVIAELRLRNFFNHTVELAQDYLHGLTYEGIVVALAGDSFSGNIHTELKETNEATVFESLLHWIDPMLWGLRLFANAFGKVSIYATPGNHGRNTHKPIAKMRAQDNLDWLFAKILERELQGDNRFYFDIATGADVRYQVFNTWYLLTHGDQFRGGSGISGLLSPLMIGDHRKRKRQQAINQIYHYLLMGHWHQREYFKNVIVNGSLKGYDEYAMLSNFDYQEPMQSFWITDPTHGVTLSAPVFVRDKSEKYRPS